MSNQVEQIPAEIEREMQEIAERAPSDFCHYSDIVDREEWCKEKFRHFFIAGMLAERERQENEAAYFPEYDSIVNKVFGAGNLESWERDEAERLVRLARAELLKELTACPTIKGWAARDEDGTLVFYDSIPQRTEELGFWNNETSLFYLSLPKDMLPTLRWEDEPKPVRVIIEEIK